MNKVFRQFFASKSCVDILYKLGKCDLKELSECLAMYRFFRNQEWVKDIKVATILDIGCGKRPTLAVMMAHKFPRTWKYIAIDPQLDVRDYNTEGLKLFNMTLQGNSLPEEVMKEVVGHPIVFFNHSHAPKECLLSLKEFEYITMPCCFENMFPNVQGTFMKDTTVHSPKNIIYHQHISASEKGYK